MHYEKESRCCAFVGKQQEVDDCCTVLPAHSRRGFTVTSGGQIMLCNGDKTESWECLFAQVRGYSMLKSICLLKPCWCMTERSRALALPSSCNATLWKSLLWCSLAAQVAHSGINAWLRSATESSLYAIIIPPSQMDVFFLLIQSCRVAVPQLRLFNSRSLLHCFCTPRALHTVRSFQPNLLISQLSTRSRNYYSDL